MLRAHGEGRLEAAGAGQGFAHCFFLLVPSLQLAGGLLSFMVSRGSGRSTSLVLDQLQLSDGRWHDLQLELRDVRSGRDSRYVITLTLDFGLYQVRAAHETPAAGVVAVGPRESLLPCRIRWLSGTNCTA